MNSISFGQKLKSTDNRNYWIVSDLHHFHSNIMKFNAATRPYSSVEEMHEAIRDDWNSKVKPNDVIFHLGDFSFGKKEQTQQVLNKLNGNIVWIAGNHDYALFKQMGLPYHHYFEVSYDNVKVCMMHYAIAAWNQQGRGSSCVHGHSHGAYKGSGRVLDVGWDSVGSIISLKEAVERTQAKEIYVADGHKIIE